MLVDIKTLKRNVDSISTNISIYENDLGKHIQSLKKYGIDGSTESHIAKLKKENRILIDKEQSLLNKANRILSRMED